ncbi:hypothetical protein R1flu_022092 [Riccia fluitans]|uniref:RING-CH-type domain-containing protein n=1 Tax=Riccia fluitans TaxID=41844 RepID=A0ABD1ZU56_9MARC
MAIPEFIAIGLELSRSIPDQATARIYTVTDQVNEGSAEEVLKSHSDCDSHDHVIDVVAVEDEVEQLDRYSYKTGTTSSCGSTLSDDNSVGYFCRICQQRSEEVVMELGCLCRGDLAAAHLMCIERWFRCRSTNKCEICQQVAINVPTNVLSRSPQRQQDFWIWRAGASGRSERPIPRNGERFIPWQEAAHFHVRPFSIALLILTVLLFFDGLIFIMLRGTPLPVKFSVGALLVSGFIATVRLVFLEIRRRLHVQHVQNLRMMPVEAQVAQSTPDPGVNGS